MLLVVALVFALSSVVFWGVGFDWVESTVVDTGLEKRKKRKRVIWNEVEEQPRDDGQSSASHPPIYAELRYDYYEYVSSDQIEKIALKHFLRTSAGLPPDLT